MGKGAPSPPITHFTCCFPLLCGSACPSWSPGASRLWPLPQLLVPASRCLLSSSSGSAPPPAPQWGSDPRAPLPPLASENTKPMEDPPSESPVLSETCFPVGKTVKYIQIHGSHQHRPRLPATPGPVPGRRNLWTSFSRGALPRRRGHLPAVGVLAKGVLLSHSGDLLNTPDPVSAVGNPGPEKAQNSWLMPPLPAPSTPQATGRGGVVESASALCYFCCVSGFPCSTLCLNYLSFS